VSVVGFGDVRLVNKKCWEGEMVSRRNVGWQAVSRRNVRGDVQLPECRWVDFQSCRVGSHWGVGVGSEENPKKMKEEMRGQDKDS
jgi:hypothetical protein